MNVTNLEQVTFGVTDLEACRRFWRDFGLTEARQPTGSVFSCRDGSAVVVRRSDDPELPPAIEPGSTLRESTFGVRSARDLAAIGAELAKDREVTEDADGTIARDRSARVPDRVSRVATQAGRRPRAQVQHAGAPGPDQHARPVLQGSPPARDDAHRVHDRQPGQDRAVLRRAARLHRERLLSAVAAIFCAAARRIIITTCS